MQAEDRRTIFRLGLTVALPHSAISPSVRPQPVQTLALVSGLQISLREDGGGWATSFVQVRRRP
jgi:hypothetical protein